MVLAALLCAACASAPRSSEPVFPALPPFYQTVPEPEALVKARALNPAGQHLASWRDLAPGLALSKIYAASKNPDDVAVARGEVAITWGQVQTTLNRLEELLPRLDAEPGLLARHFTWIGLSEGAEFSGYYESEIKASRVRTPRYAWPLYRKPSDLHSVDLGDFKPMLIGQRLVYRLEKGEAVPYYERSEIDTQGVLAGRGLELAWVADPLDAFFLQLQGSGRLRYDDGTVVHILYAGDNGRPYLSLGRHLSDQGLLEPDNVSMQSIRKWLNEHPERRDEILALNKRYVFFRLADDGPIGSMGRRLTSFPLGAVLAFDVSLPVPGGKAGTPVHGIGLAQDTGEAIRGRRVDLFCGSGAEAEFVAGHLNAPGQVWMLIAR